MGFPPQGTPLAPLKWPYVSTYSTQLQLTAGVVDTNLPDVVLPPVVGRTPKKAVAFFKWRATENTNAGANKLNGAQSIRVKIAAGAWGVDDIPCIDFVDDLFAVEGDTREMGDLAYGVDDLIDIIPAMGATYNFRWENAIADLANLNFDDVQMGLLVELQ